jgi:hypothetical protein
MTSIRLQQLKEKIRGIQTELNDIDTSTLRSVQLLFHELECPIKRKR